MPRATPVDVEAPGRPCVAATATSVVSRSSAELTGHAPRRRLREAPAARSGSRTRATPAIDAQLAYVLTYWSSYNSAEYPVIGGFDCANFASQSLIARGWAMDGGWYFDRGDRRDVAELVELDRPARLPAAPAPTAPPRSTTRSARS